MEGKKLRNRKREESEKTEKNWRPRWILRKTRVEKERKKESRSRELKVQLKIKSERYDEHVTPSSEHGESFVLGGATLLRPRVVVSYRRDQNKN